MKVSMPFAIASAVWSVIALPSSFGQTLLNRTIGPPRPTVAQARPAPNDPIVLLLKGIYQPVVKSPSLGLSGVTIDSTWTFTEIHSVTSVPGSTNQDTAVVGHFYSPSAGPLVAYDLPGGSMLMEFTGGNWGPPIPDGKGGFYYQETWDLTILEATGIYAPYAGGHNHMVDRFHSLSGDFLSNPSAPGPFDEDCYCIISVAGALPLWWTSN
jgi:hypothetical protein